MRRTPDPYRQATPLGSRRGGRRQMATPRRAHRDHPPRRGLAILSVGVLGLALLIVGATLAGSRPGMPGAGSTGTALAAQQDPSGAVAGPSDTIAMTPEASTRPRRRPSPTPSGPRAGETPSSTPAPSATPSAEPSPVPTQREGPPPGNAAPTSPEGFDLENTLVPIAFPFGTGTKYRYRDNYGDVRVGTWENYNHVRRIGGQITRAHDGVDIYARIGAPLLAPVSGTVINPASRWKPWAPLRYGLVVAIVSDEPASEGYVVLLCHLSRMDVKPGDHVERGQVVGLNGRTGNAATNGILPHVHMEIRAPFKLSVMEAGQLRKIDAFNPYRSIRAADPRRD